MCVWAYTGNTMQRGRLFFVPLADRDETRLNTNQPFHTHRPDSTLFANTEELFSHATRSVASPS